VLFSRTGGKILEELAQITPENYPPFAVSPREQITGGDGRIKPCATDAGYRAGFRDRKSFADGILSFNVHSRSPLFVR
jgi:hypothetical protein